MQTMKAMIRANAQAKIKPALVRVETSTRTPTQTSFSKELRLPRQSCAAPRCNPTAAPSRLRPAMAATDPTTNRTAVDRS